MASFQFLINDNTLTILHHDLALGNGYTSNENYYHHTKHCLCILSSTVHSKKRIHARNHNTHSIRVVSTLFSFRFILFWLKSLVVTGFSFLYRTRDSDKPKERTVAVVFLLIFILCMCVPIVNEVNNYCV